MLLRGRYRIIDRKKLSLSILLCRFINVVLAVFCLFPPYRPTYLENIKLSLAIGGRMRIDCYANGQSVRARVCCPVTHLPIVSFAKTETSSSSTRSKWKEAREREREDMLNAAGLSLSLHINLFTPIISLFLVVNCLFLRPVDCGMMECSLPRTFARKIDARLSIYSWAGQKSKKKTQKVFYLLKWKFNKRLADDRVSIAMRRTTFLCSGFI